VTFQSLNLEDETMDSGLQMMEEMVERERLLVWVYIDCSGKAYSKPPENIEITCHRVTAEKLNKLVDNN